MICVFFFFSSRRRHTRLVSDWSSDVCSSDLDPELGPLAQARGVRILDARRPPPNLPIADGRAAEVDALVVLAVEIGRASCRERVEISVRDVSLKKKKMTR